MVQGITMITRTRNPTWSWPGCVRETFWKDQLSHYRCPSIPEDPTHLVDDAMGIIGITITDIIHTEKWCEINFAWAYVVFITLNHRSQESSACSFLHGVDSLLDIFQYFRCTIPYDSGSFATLVQILCFLYQLRDILRLLLTGYCSSALW